LAAEWQDIQMIGGRLPVRKAEWSLEDHPPYGGRRSPADVLDDEDALADLVEAWLYDQGLKAVPIGRDPGPVDVVNVRMWPSGGGSAVSTDRTGMNTRVDSLRRSRREADLDEVIRLGSLEIDLARRTVHVGTGEVHLTPTEFRLLRHLAEHSDRVVSHRELLGMVWGPGYGDDIHLLQVTMRSLRARISMVTRRQLIETVYGAGYRMASLDRDESEDLGTGPAGAFFG
jgi:DNA-binding winged helix-turn-helix (wHTH) protein